MAKKAGPELKPVAAAVKADGAEEQSGGDVVDLREKLRQRLLTPHERRRIAVTLFGEEVEMIQPTLQDVAEMRADDDDDGRVASIEMIIKHTVVPGTDEKVFTPEDMDTILAWPMGAEIIAVQEAVLELTSIDITDAKQDLVGNQ